MFYQTKRKFKSFFPASLLVVLFFFLVSFILLFPLIISHQPIGLSYDWSTPQSLFSYIRNPMGSAWSSGSLIPPGNYNYFLLFYKICFFIGFDNLLITKIFLVLNLTIAGYAFHLLIAKIIKNHIFSVLGGVLYLSSYYLLVIIHHGYLGHLLSYSMVPLLLYFYLTYNDSGKWRPLILASLFMSFAGVPLQYFIISFILLLLISFLYYKNLKRTLIGLTVLITINIILSAGWLGVYLFNWSLLKSYSDLITGTGTEVFQNNSIMDLFYLPWSFSIIKDYFNSLNISWVFYFWRLTQILLLALPLLILAFHEKFKIKGLKYFYTVNLFFLVVIFIIAKGYAEPWPWTGQLFYLFPFSGLFRDLNHLYFLIVFILLIIFIRTADLLYTHYSKKNIRQIILSIICGYFIISLSPFILGIYSNQVNQFDLSQPEYRQLVGDFNQDLLDYKVIWLPLGMYVHYLDSKDDLFNGVNPLRNEITKEDWLDLGVSDNKPSLLFKVIYFGYGERIKNVRENFLGLLNVKQIVNLKSDFESAVPNINSKDYYQEERYLLADEISFNSTLKNSNEQYDLYDSSESYYPHIYSPKTITDIEGSAQNLLDGIIFSQSKNSAYLINSSDSPGISNIVIPIEFTEDSSNKITHNDFQLVSEINIPRDGKYNINFYQKNRLSDTSFPLFTIKTVDFNSKQIILEKIDGSLAIEKNEIINFPVDLIAGQYTVFFNNTVNANNLIFNNSFEYGEWINENSDCFSSPGSVSVEGSEDDHFLQFKSQEAACRFVVVGGVAPQQKYLFSYNFKNIQGQKPKICLKESDDSYCHELSRTNYSSDWQHEEFVFELGDSDRAIIYLSVPGGQEESINQFDNFELKQVEIPETIAFTLDTSFKAVANRVEYKKISSSKYKAIIRQAQGIVPLVLTENWSPAWTAYLINSQEELPEYTGSNFVSPKYKNTIQNDNLDSGHWYDTILKEKIEIGSPTKINSYFNGWFIDAGDQAQDLELIIEFKPQRHFIIGSYLSLICFMIIIIYCLASYLIDFRKK